MKTLPRCPWCEGFDLYRQYHDTEWGVPIHDSRQLFELLILEGAQAGLSWSTVLRKRESYREAFNQFDPKKIAKYDDQKVVELLSNPGIIRNRLKVSATIGNAKAYLALEQSGQPQQPVCMFEMLSIFSKFFSSSGNGATRSYASSTISGL